MMSKLNDITNNLVAKTCNFFGGSLSDLEPEDAEAEFEAQKQIKDLMTSSLDRIIAVCNDERITQIDTVKAFVEAEREDVGKL